MSREASAPAATTETPLQGKRALVAGASRGIGEAVAGQLLEAGMSVVALARSAEGLQVSRARMPAPQRYLPFACDLASDAGLQSLAQHGHARELDVLVLSSGTMHTGTAVAATLAQFDEQYAANLRAPYALIQAALPGLVARRGQVVLICSSAALRGRAGAGQYAALQAATRSLGESIRDEINPDGVRLLTVFPGSTAGARQQALHRSAGVEYREEFLMQPDDVARMVLAALRLPQSAEVTELHIRPMKKR